MVFRRVEGPGEEEGGGVRDGEAAVVFPAEGVVVEGLRGGLGVSVVVEGFWERASGWVVGKTYLFVPF